MKNFSYTAVDAKGKTVKGNMPAEDEKEFLAKIRAKGLVSKSYEETDSKSSKTLHKFTTKELSFNCRQLSAMLTSGLTLVKALDILCKEQEKESAKLIWRDIYENVQKGESFSASLELYKGVFPPFLISMVAAGEASGSLDVIMQRMSAHYDKENKMHNTIKSSMMYPAILMVLCVVIVILMFTFIIPTFAGMFDDPNDIPVLTRIMMNISDFIISKWYILVIVIGAIVFGINYALKVPSIRLKFDRMLVKMPSVGPLMVTIYTSRFARTFCSLYSSGIPMVECIQRAADILGNSYISQCFETVVDEVKQGEPLSASVQRTEIFESMFCSLIYVGEESGALDSILENASGYYEEEADTAVQNLVHLIEPVAIIFMGVVVCMVLMAVFPALYGSFENIQ